MSQKSSARCSRRSPTGKRLPPNVPPSVHRLLRLCLDKEIREIASAVTRPMFASTLSTQLRRTGDRGVPSAPVPRRPRLAWMRGRDHCLLGTRRRSHLVGRAARSLRVVRTAIPAAGPAALGIDGRDRDLTITPDGRQDYLSRHRLIRCSCEPSMKNSRRFSPASACREAFSRLRIVSGSASLTGTQLKKMAITGGPAVLITLVECEPRGATWGPDDTIVYATSAVSDRPSARTRSRRQAHSADEARPATRAKITSGPSSCLVAGRSCSPSCQRRQTVKARSP